MAGYNPTSQNQDPQIARGIIRESIAHISSGLTNLQAAMHSVETLKFHDIYLLMEDLEEAFGKKTFVDAAFAFLAQRDDAGRLVSSAHATEYFIKRMNLSYGEAMDRLRNAESLFGKDVEPDLGPPPTPEPESNPEDLPADDPSADSNDAEEKAKEAERKAREEREARQRAEREREAQERAERENEAKARNRDKIGKSGRIRSRVLHQRADVFHRVAATRPEGRNIQRNPIVIDNVVAPGGMRCFNRS